MAYIAGQPVEITQPLPEITPDYSAGGVSAADAADALATAVHFAKVLEPAMVHRYLHTKKKRTRKKYEKRICAWFREVFL